MSNIFIFEDNEEMPVSRLLGMYGNIYFSHGSRRLRTKLDLIYANHSNIDNIIIFFDFVPNNINTHNMYLELKTYIIEKGYQNVYIVPILCIEYYVLKMLTEHYVFKTGKEYNHLIKCLVKEINWGNIPDDKKYTSIEVIYKEILRNSAKRCMRNEKDGGGRFYTISSEDCSILNSAYPGCRDACGDLYKKFYRLYTLLPVFDNEILYDNIDNLSYSNIDINCVLEKMDMFYENVFQNMGLEKLICFTS